MPPIRVRDMKPLIDAIMSLSPHVRYVAVYRDGELTSSSRPDLQGASSSESDRYEEIIVNPTLTTLVRQRGEIDCGGLEFVLIRYGSFFQFVVPISRGHVSVAVEPHADPLALSARIQALTRSLFTESPTLAASS